MGLAQVLIVDDHRLFRSGLRYILEESGKYIISGEASNGREFLNHLEQEIPDLTILDINMPVMNGIEATRLALEKHPRLKILILSMYGETAYYNQLIDLGVKGFLLKESEKDEFIQAVDKVLAGGTYFSQELLLSIIKKDLEPGNVTFTRREKEVLILIGQGHSNAEIASLLNISQRTVERHRTHLLEKTGSKNSISLVVYALKHKMIQF